MNLFKKLFKKSHTAVENEGQDELKNEADNVKPGTANNSTGFDDFVKKNFSFDASPESFKTELYDSFRRYYAEPTLKFNINLTDPVTGVNYEPHEAFNAVYDEWKTIHSSWDRRSLLFSFWVRPKGISCKNGRLCSGITMIVFL